MRLDVRQRSTAWEREKLSRIGSSEIFGLIDYYISEKELQNVGINKDKFTDKPYQTAFELYHKIKNPHLYTGLDLKKSQSDFGAKGEELSFEYIACRPEFNSTYSKGGVYTSGMLIASLDIEAVASSVDIIYDINNNPISLSDTPNYLIEIKFTSPFSRSPDKPLDWKFIFQAQQAMRLSGCEWCMIKYFSLNEDNDFTRGYLCGLGKRSAMKYLVENSTVETFIISKRPEYQYLIELAIERFTSDLRSSNEPDITESAAGEMLYSLVAQKGALLDTFDMLLEVDESAVLKYYELGNKSEEIEAEQKRIRSMILQGMLNTGKSKAGCSVAKISLNKRGLLMRRQS